ncbi:MAG: hypothetical protein LBV19_02765 [Streptococcaceae bacterium]|jgi:hypothetical protein|nr:hypothetical protein [Streptococcaceae bacterium]
MKSKRIDYFFIGWTILEVTASAVLLMFLPNTIKLNFGFILTSKLSEGSKFNILALPLLMFVTSYFLVKLSLRFYQSWQRIALIVLNLIVFVGTSFFLVQLITEI